MHDEKRKKERKKECWWQTWYFYNRLNPNCETLRFLRQWELWSGGAILRECAFKMRLWLKWSKRLRVIKSNNEYNILNTEETSFFFSNKLRLPRFCFQGKYEFTLLILRFNLKYQIKNTSQILYDIIPRYNLWIYENVQILCILG